MGMFVIYEMVIFKEKGWMLVLLQATPVMVPEGGFYRTVRIMQKTSQHHELFCNEDCSRCRDYKNGTCRKYYGELLFPPQEVSVKQKPDWLDTPNAHQDNPEMIKNAADA